MRPLNFRTVMAAPKHVVIELYDMIGPAWLGMVDETTMSQALKEAGDVDEITLRINSEGGDAFSGLAIYNLLRDQKATVNVIVDGIAASAATLPVMAGKNVRIPKSAMLMIHDPMTFAAGGVSDHQNAIKNLEATKRAAIAAYASRTGLSSERLAQMMTDETWMTGEEAVALKFADTIGGDLPEVPAAAQEAVKPRMQFRNAPPQFLKLVATCAAATPVSKDDPMTTATPAAPPAAAAPTATPTAPAAAAPTATPTAPAAAVTAPQLSAQNTATPQAGPAAAIAPTATAAPQAAPVAQVVDFASQVQMAIGNERKRVADITAMCAKAGCPDRAQKWINEGTAVSDVQNALFDVMCASRPPVGGESSGGPQMATGDEAFKKEYFQGRQTYMAAGISEEQYIKSRRIDLGLEPLVIGGAAAK